MEPPDPLPLPPAFDDADALALADIAADRVVTSETVAHWLGGWHLARLERQDAATQGLATSPTDREGGAHSAVAPSTAYPRSTSASHTRPAAGEPLVWSDAAIAGCHRIRRLLAGYGAGSDRRLAIALVAAMVELIVDGHALPPGIDDVPLLPPLVLRIVVAEGRIAVLGLRWTGSIT